VSTLFLKTSGYYLLINIKIYSVLLFLISPNKKRSRFLVVGKEIFSYLFRVSEKPVKSKNNNVSRIVLSRVDEN
jgi:hypothetical protein